jgi:cytoskeletal protein CcmA (bactofilin family)
MAVGRISGPLLKSNLIRNGVDLAFETDLLYLDVNNQRIGVRTASPTHDLTVNGTTRTTNLIVDTLATIGNVSISGQTIETDGDLNLVTVGTDSVVYQTRLEVNGVGIDNNTISTLNSNANLELRPNGSGTVEIFADTNVTGNIHATGNISADGDIVLGNADTDSINFNADVNSNIIPDQTDFYDLGSDTKRWNDVKVKNIVADTVDTGDLIINGVDLSVRPGNTYFVSTNGSNTATGTHQQDPFLTLDHAVTVATAGDTIHIYPGTYEETFPITVPAGVTIKGENIRSVFLHPPSSNNSQDCFLLNGETTIQDLTIGNFYYDSGNNTGHAFRFAPNMNVTSRSPYIKNITVITKGSVTTTEDPRGFNEGDAGRGGYFDGAAANANSKEASILFHSATFITPGVDAISATNGTRMEWLNSFTYFANRSVYAFDSNQGLYNDGKTRVRLGGISGTFAAGNTVTFTSTDNSSVANATIESIEGDTIVVDGKFTGLQDFDTTPASITNGSGATATSIENYDLKDFGAEIRMIGSASVYGNYGLYGDGPGVIVYAIGHNLAYIGNGKEVTNDPGTVIQDNEVTELNDAKIRYNSVDHEGDFRVGDLFFVDQQTGTVDFTVSDFTINTTNGVSFIDGGGTTFVDGTKIETGNFRLSGNTIESLTGAVNLTASNNQINLNDNVSITGNLDVTGNVTIGGNITIGDDANDTIQIVAGIDSDIVPSATSTYNLGTDLKRWNNINVNRAVIDDITIETNFITTTNSNADLELRASGTGEILVPDNNVQIDNNLTVDGTTTLQDTNITGTLTHVGNLTHTGDSSVDGNLTVTGKLDVTQYAQFEEILIDDNFITTTTSNANLELRANGTGEVIVPSANVTITNDLTVDNDIDANNLTTTGTVTAGAFTTGQINISNYVVQTVSSNDLELSANGSGVIKVAYNDVDITGTLDVTGLTTTSDLTINGTLTHTGNVSHTGNYDITGTWTNQEIRIIGNVVETTTTNTDLELRASGSGDVLIPNDDVILSQDLTVNGTTDLQATTINGTVTHTGDHIQTGNLTITGLLEVDDIEINGNTIQAATNDTDLQLTANGTGEIVVPTSDVVITNNLTVNGTTTLQDTSVTGTLTHVGDRNHTGNFNIGGTFSNGEIQIDDNFITTTTSNADLELRASGTGEVTVQGNDVVFGQALTVSGATDLQATTITGIITHTGNVTQTGNLNLTGDFDNGNLSIAANVIQTTDSNADLELRAQGSGKILVPNNDLQVTGTLDVDQLTTLDDTNITGVITHVGNSTITGNYDITGQLNVNDVSFDTNRIFTNTLDTDLILEANNTGKVIVPNNDVEIEENLTVGVGATLQNTNITGTVTHAGNYTQTGNSNIDGNLTVTQDLDITGSAQFEEILIDDNFITTTTSNADLELRANGTGEVLIPDADLRINNDLIVTGTITTGDINSAGTITANRFSTGDILIDDNFITTTTSNSDLELRANGTGEVIVPNNNVEITGDTTVSGTTDLNGDTGITGTLTHIGNLSQTGNFNITGSLTVTGDLDVSGAFQFEEILIDDNVITTTSSNADLEFRAAGTGEIIIPSNDVNISNNLTVDGTLTVGNIVSTGTIQANNFTTGDILIDDNFITTTTSNSDLELRTSGTGSIVLDDISIIDSTISSTSNITLQPDTELVILDATGALQLPSGNTAQRPSGVLGQIRYNAQLNRYEGYTNIGWLKLDGLEDADGDTKVTAELSPGANDNTIRFVVSGNTIASVTETKLDANLITVDDIQLDGNVISTITNNTDLQLTGNGTGAVNIENFKFDDGTITNVTPNGVTTIVSTNQGYVDFSDPYGVVIPVGNNTERPTGVTGMIRFNTEDLRVEMYDGSNWISVAGASGGISYADAEDIAIEKVLIFG